jgi:long-chain acyl-CoA synthetase
MFIAQAERLAGRPFLWAKKGGVYQSLSWAEARDQVMALARALRALGIGDGDRVVLCSENRPEWIIANLGVMAAGAITVPAYVTNTVNDHHHIFADSAAKAAIVSTARLAERLVPAARLASDVEVVIAMEDPGPSLVRPRLMLWSDALANGRASSGATPSNTRGRDDTAVIIYTSGTGGTPKGVMLAHKSILHNLRGAADAVRELGLDDNVFLSFLPLSHSYEFTGGQFFPIYIGAEIYFAEGLEHLSRNLTEARPTLMTAVPRLYELMHGRIMRGIEKQSGLKPKLFLKAVELGRRQVEHPGSLSLGERVLNALLERLVRSKVRNSFGGRLKALVSGGAPLNYEIGMFFSALGLCLLQGYGQTESAPVISVNRPSNNKLRTVGPPILDTEVKIAPDGEILVRGELVMQGYWRNEEATREAIRDGWLHTGDVGRMDNENYIEITDRKKDIIVNSGGDTLSPQRVEGFLTVQREIAQAMVHGDKRPHLVGLIVPNADFAAEWAGRHGKPADLATLIADHGFIGAIDAAVQRVNAELSVGERIRRYILIAEPFTTENEMMTPSLKVRRHKVRERYGARLEGLYQRT